MFYTANKVKPYPNKSIIEDVLTRDGNPTIESFTPFRGCAGILRKQFETMDTNGNISAIDIINSADEFSVNKARANDDGADRDSSAREIKDYYKNLEDIEQDFIDKYITSIIIGFKKHNNGLNSQKHLMRTVEKVYDEEEDDYVDLTDLLLVEQDFTAEDILEAKSRLPYILKQLHDGSLLMGGSLLSFIIAAEKCLSGDNASSHLKPMYIVNKGVWRMEMDGSMVNQFRIEDNTAEKFRNLYAWICGNGLNGRNNMYYKAYRELLDVCAILDIDIRDEDATAYDGKYIDKIICTYIATNEEYVETYGYYDQKILNMLEPEELFRVAKSLSSIESDNAVKMTTSVLAEYIANSVDRLKFDRPKVWEDDFEKVKRFLAKYTGKGEKRLNNYICTLDIYKGVLKDGDGEFLYINVDDLVTGRCAMLSSAGKLILFANDTSMLTVLDTDKAIRILDGEEEGGINAWTRVSL